MRKQGTEMRVMNISFRIVFTTLISMTFVTYGVETGELKLFVSTTLLCEYCTLLFIYFFQFS